jgi:hypothetical protein
LQDRVRETWSYTDFGAKLDGVTDDSAAMAALIAACAATGKAKRVLVPAGVSLLSQAFTITTPIRFVGEGYEGPVNGAAPSVHGSTFKYTGAAGATFFTVANVNYGDSGFEGIALDCNSLAAAGLVMDGVLGSRNSMSILGYTNFGLKLEGLTTTCSWNLFPNLYLISSPAGTGKCALWLTGAAGVGNACHNRFDLLHIDHGGTSHGIYLGGCDNNSFGISYIYRSAGGTGYGVYNDTSEMTGFPVNNSFDHLQAIGGWFQPADTINQTATINAYMRDNGEPLPTLSANGSLLLDAKDCVYPVTLTKGTGWSGGTPTLFGFYNKSGRTVTLSVFVQGTGVVAAQNATITGAPPNTGNAYFLGIGSGVNTGGGGAALYGNVSGSTITVTSGITSTTAADMMFTYLVN